MSADDRIPVENGTRIGPYRVESFLARGGMGVVVRAYDENLDRPVAIKLIDPRFGADEEFRARFSREVKVLAAIQHPNIVAIYYQDEFKGMPFFAMELVGGFSLDRLLEDMPKLDWRTSVGWMIECCSALEAARVKEIIHRDLKPANILINENNQVRIVDFGLAKQEEVSKDLTAASVFLGTPHYVSPEQATGKKLDWRSDLYSLGATFYRVFSGRPVFDAPSVPEIVTAHIREIPRPLADVAGGLPVALTDLIDRSLAKDPDLRGESYGDTMAELEAILHGNPEGDTSLSSTDTVIGKLPEVAESLPSATVGTRVQSAPMIRSVGPEPPLYSWLLSEDPEHPMEVVLARAPELPFGSHTDVPLFVPDDPKNRRLSRRQGAFVWHEGTYHLLVEPARGAVKPQIRLDKGSVLPEGRHPVGPGSVIGVRGVEFHLEGTHEGGLRLRFRGPPGSKTAGMQDAWSWILFGERLLAGTAPRCGLELPAEVGAEELFTLEVLEEGVLVRALAPGLEVDGSPVEKERLLERESTLSGPGFCYRFRTVASARQLWEG